LKLDDVVMWCVAARQRTRRIRSRTHWHCMSRELSGLVSRHRSQRASKSRPICRYLSCQSLFVGAAVFRSTWIFMPHRGIRSGN